MGFFLKSKDQILDMFKHFYISIEREIEKQLRYIQVNNGGE